MEISISLSQQSENLLLIISLFYVFILVGIYFGPFLPPQKLVCLQWTSHCCHEFGISQHLRQKKKKAQIRMKMKFLIETNLHNS